MRKELNKSVLIRLIQKSRFQDLEAEKKKVATNKSGTIKTDKKYQ